MASNYSSSSGTTTKILSSNWTEKDNKLFETALAMYDKDTPDRWLNVAKFVGGKTQEEIKIQYKLLLRDVQLIEDDKIPLPKYKEQQANQQ